mmetsp:Transcript_16449/g.35626  ORF Transcript_16449/g.35626 Transcript_16449/m.35626 type:complete len:177 (-) Transcript_16449:29-559(-)
MNNEDLSHLIKSVSFTLHPSFKTPTRVLEEPPFMVTETGWGEFEVPMTITLHEPEDATLDVRHGLALFPGEAQQMSTKKPVVSEHYDELVFVDPPESILKRIELCKQTTVHPGPLEGNLSVFSEEQELMRIQAALRRVQTETELLKDRFKSAAKECSVLRSEVEKVDHDRMDTSAG